MTTPSTPPDEPVYRGTTVTPESPRPVHIPEPTNILVLEKQTDPIFNLTSTHMSSAPPVPAVAAVVSDGAAQPTPDEAPAVTAPTDASGMEGIQGAQAGLSTIEEKAMPATGGASLPQHEQSEMSLQTGSATDASLAQAFDPSQQSAVNIGETGATSPSEALPSLPPATAAETQPADPNQPSASDMTTVDLTSSSAAEAVNYQALIDHIIPSNAAELAPEGEPAGLAAPSEVSDIPQPNSANLPSALPAPGLPPRPPPQEKPSIHPNYSTGEDIRSYHFPNLTPTSATIPPNGTFPGTQPFPSPVAPAPGTTGIPPAPGTYPTFAQQSEAQGRESHQSQRARNEAARRGNVGDRHDNAPWGPDIQKMYDQFLDDEKVYTAEGTWDRFPKDSRLFVGNLPTDVVTKRDIFHIFYRYGRLAQISIKNAYGFVQFMDESACRTAMHSEQGKKIKEKSMHLEISKPPKNSRNAAVTAAGECLRASHYRRSRSRSPDRRQGSRNDRQNRGSGDHRDSFRRSRDDYRPGRSPSPGRGGRDSYRGGRDRSPDRYGGGRRDRSRSPYGRYRNRSPSPRRNYNDDDGVPLSRRNPRDVPEVQIILVDQLDRGFVDFVQNAFRARSLSVAVLPMPGGVSLDAVVKRQIVEGVMAVIKLFRASQATAKIPVQIFDRTGGMNQVRFEEYEELEPHVAAELVIRSKQKQATAAINAQPQYGSALQQLGINLPNTQQQPHQQASSQPNIANLITQLDGPALQKLLGAMQNPNTPQGQHPQQSPTQNLGFGPMMAAGPPQPNPPNPGHGYSYSPQHGPGGPGAPPQPQGSYGYQGAPPLQQQQPPQQQQNAPYNYTQGGPPPNPNQVQNIMSQLAQWRR